MTLNFKVDDTLVNAMIDAGEKGFRLGGRNLTCVSVGKMQPTSLSPVSGIIGIVGRVNGSILVNMSESVALAVTGGMLMSEYNVLNPEVLDAVAEVTNVIGGRMKSSLATSGYPMDNITLPSVIVGQNYFIQQARGMIAYTVGLMIEDESVPKIADRLVQVVLTVLTSDLKPSGQ